MTAAQFEMLEATEAEELLRARFESLTWHGCPPGNALVIASHLDVELLDAIVLLQRGCPPHLVVPCSTDVLQPPGLGEAPEATSKPLRQRKRHDMNAAQLQTLDPAPARRSSSARGSSRRASRPSQNGASPWPTRARSPRRRGRHHRGRRPPAARLPGRSRAPDPRPEQGSAAMRLLDDEPLEALLGLGQLRVDALERSDEQLARRRSP